MFDLPDEVFIGQAYWRVLGRPADPAGFSNYLAELRKGRSRIQIVSALQSSQEASVSPGLANDDVPSIASILMLRPAQESAPLGGWRRLKRLRRIKDADLLTLRGPLFVEAAFAVLLGRLPQETELKETEATDTLEGRTRLLRSLRTRAPFHMRFWPREPSTRKPGPSHAALDVPPGAPSQRQAGARPGTETEGTRITSLPPADGSRTAAFTIATRSYLPFVRVLMQSLRAAHDDFQCYVLLVEDSTCAEDEGPWITVLARDLGLEQFDDMSVRYDVVEICTALKPMFFRWLLQTTSLQRLIYLDPDIRLYRPLTELEQAFEQGAALVLTPHIDAPLPDDGLPDTLTILKSGAFNLGFAALQRCEEADRFLAWWAQQLQTQALVSFEQNLFTDQRWCDLAPSFVPSLALLRNHGYNLAYWNLPQRTLQKAASGSWDVGDGPLTFFHFSGFSPKRAEQLSKYQTRALEGDIPALRPLLADYAAELMANGWNLLHGLPYAYGHIGGVKLSPMARSLFRAIHPISSGLSRAAILDLLLEQSMLDPLDLQSSDVRLSPLMRHVHATRPDVGRVFDIGIPSGRFDYAAWFWSTGLFEHGLDSLVREARISATATSPEAITSS